MEPITETAAAAVPAASRYPENGRQRLIVERVSPEIDAGRFPIKRTVGEEVDVNADLFADGHDLIAGVLRYRHLATSGDGEWREVPLRLIENDRWGATFRVEALGRAEYTIEAWADHFSTWLKGLIAKAEAGQDVSSELLEGAELVQRAASRPGHDAGQNLRLLEIADKLRSDLPQRARVSAAREAELKQLMDARPDRSESTTYERVLSVIVDPVRARYGAWYEMFPRSVTPDPTRSGTFREAESRLQEIASMGFDVLYLPPIHPSGGPIARGATTR
jgi:starch synthase (maltosyl-transferring)